MEFGAPESAFSGAQVVEIAAFEGIDREVAPDRLDSPQLAERKSAPQLPIWIEEGAVLELCTGEFAASEARWRESAVFERRFREVDSPKDGIVEKTSGERAVREIDFVELQVR